MASKKKQKAMVFHQEGAAAPEAAPAADHPPVRFVVPKPGKASEGGMEQSTCVTNEEAGVKGKPKMHPSREPIRTSGGLPAVKHSTSLDTQPDTVSPDSICKGIKVTLDNNSMWNEFFRCKTEMILTQQGSRMFPYCRFRISGLHPSKKYSLIMDIQPLDNSLYKWTGKSWQVAGKAECHVKSQPFAHPESPSVGQHWMQNPVSFYKLKLTNNTSDKEGNTTLHPMHRYLPRLHVVQTDKAAKDIKLNGPSVVTFTFPQTEFMAVTAYQNSRFSQLKVDYNPFAKGLKEEGSSSLGPKLKLNSVKDSHKDGSTATTEQHPVKKSLKSLLANHKPRSTKAADSEPSGSGELQKKSTTNNDQSDDSVSGERSCSNSHPAQKLFSELMREAHVSLHRCDQEELAINNSTSHRTERTNTKTTASKSNKQDFPKGDSISVKTQSKTSPPQKGEAVARRKVKEVTDNSLNCKDNGGTISSNDNNVVAAPAVSQNSSVHSDQQHKPEAQSEVKVKRSKRPAPLPLPALALFLKQHSTKSKVTKSKLDSPPPVLPSESQSYSQSSAAAPAYPPSDHAGKATGPSKDLTGDITTADKQASGHTAALSHPDEMVLNVTEQAVETAHKPSSPSCPDFVASTDPKGVRADDSLASVSVAEGSGPEPAVPDGTQVLPNSDQPFCTLGTTVSTIYTTIATSSAASTLSPPLDTVLTASNSPQTQTISESSTLPSDLPTTKSDSLLPDPECSSFGFEPLSPASSPEPLPSLPILLALDLNSTTSEPTPKAVSPEELQHGEDSAASVFKWHTVLPPPRPYIDTTYTTFQSTPQTHPSGPDPSPLLPSQTPSHPDPQTLDTSTSTPPPDPAPSFQENESLLFPAELSPLALHLPLSPTFSSLDGDALSPTPSIADLVQFFSTDDDLGMEVAFSNTEAVAAPCLPPPTTEANAHEPSQEVQPTPANKPCRGRKKSRRPKLAKTDMVEKMDVSTYTSMKPNLEEVEEQLFISFTSKEALKLHVADSSVVTASQPEMTPECHLQPTADAPSSDEKAETEESLGEKLAAFEKILLRDLKLVRHRQVIHPVLQEVGLKLNLLDPTLAIDLQYLGVRLPIPPPGVSLEPLTQELPPPPPPGVSAAFVSRTGKTTDVTQIKGWREKFTPSEAPPTPAPIKPEAGPSSEPPKKNLSAFCSDMLDEYLENEGKLIDERAASFSQPAVEPPVYQLPTRSTSYVRTLDSVLKKQTSPTSDLISGFIPPSKRPKPPLRETKTSRKRGPKPRKHQAEPGPAPALSPAESGLIQKPAAVQIPAAPSAEAPLTDPHTPKKYRHRVRLDPADPRSISPPPKRRRRLKPKTSCQTLSPHKSTAPPPSATEDMAPLESDSELGADQSGGPPTTRALLRQKDLEDEVVWGGRPRTCITEERATVALTSLFTLMGFVRENPTAPIQLTRRRAPRCLNEFCRLGCVCSSLSHCARISHCGRPQCMLGCSCLKQKVVLLKNLDASDCSPSQPANTKRRRRKRRMKMAYILKEADSVSQPAERVRTLWKRGVEDSDPDPINAPKAAALPRPPVRTDRREDRREDRWEDRREDVLSGGSSCARARAFRGKKKSGRKAKRKDQLRSLRAPQQEASQDVKSKKLRLQSLKQRDLTLKDAKTKPSAPPPAGEP
ncbi:MAX gene-associated protein-like, partial [Plectropomus leopardus]|uniref:MAX gene-associated protein-like n=1 Tax=Plectropomus leopardus TaxID=160734 RepID=UPI001C4D53CF